MTELTNNERFSALADRIDSTNEQVAIAHGRVDEVMGRLDSTEQPSCDKLYEALAKAQSEFKSAELDAEGQVKNRRYSYATLSSVITATREPLSKNGLSVMQLPTRAASDKGGECLGLTTILAHESGQSIENYFEMLVPDPTPQGIGSAMTYMRRYARMSILDIAGASDDDAESAQPKIVSLKPEQIDEILNMADELFGDDSDGVLERMCNKVFQVDAVGKIPAAGFDAAKNSLNNKKKRDEAKRAKPADENGSQNATKSQAKPSA